MLLRLPFRQHVWGKEMQGHLPIGRPREKPDRTLALSRQEELLMPGIPKRESELPVEVSEAVRNR